MTRLLAALMAMTIATAAGADTETRLRRHVEVLTAIDPPRNFHNPASLDAAAGYIRAQLEEAGWEVRDQVYEVDGAAYRNLVARRGDPDAPRLVVGAHYDVHGDTPGADDNASGVAVLIELARVLADYRPDRGLELVAYTLEEQPAFARGIMGSARHAENLAREDVDVAGMLALEMLGYYREEPGTQGFPAPFLDWLYPDTGDFIGLIGRLRDLNLLRRTAAAMRSTGGVEVHYLASPVSFRGLDSSDHRSYWEAGWNAIMVTDTAYYRNPNYHRAGDTPDTLDYGRMAALVPQIAAAVRKLTRQPNQEGNP